MRAELAAPPGPSRSRPEASGAAAADDDDQAAWAREEQQMIMQEQDHAMDSISGTLHTIAEQAGLIGREVVEHNESVPPRAVRCALSLTALPAGC
jgi:hypothetical protein